MCEGVTEYIVSYLCEGSTQSDHPPVNCLTLNTPPSPPTYVGGVYTPPTLSLPYKRGKQKK